MDNDFGPGTIGFQTNSATVAEAVQFLTLNVSRTNGASGSVSVRYATADGSAQAFPGGGADTNVFDYYSTNGQLNFGDGEMNKVILIKVIDNDRIDDSRTFTVGLFSPGGGATLGLATNTVTILDGPERAIGQLFLTSTNYSVSESAGVLRVDIERNRGTGGRVGVTVSTEDISAVAGVDYVPIRQLIVFNDGETRRTVQIPILPDALVEGPEYFFVRLSNPTLGAQLAATNSFARVTIDDDDARPGVFAFSTDIYHAKEGETALITVIRTNGSVGRAEVDVAISTGFSVNPQFLPATNGIHYKAGAGGVHLTFFEGETVKRFSVATIPTNLPNYIAVDPNEPVNDSFLTATTLPPALDYAQFAGPFLIFEGNSPFPLDVDNYRVELKAGINYKFRAWTELKENTSADDLQLSLLDSRGAILQSSSLLNTTQDEDPEFVFTPPTNGTYGLRMERLFGGAPSFRQFEHIRYFIDYGPVDITDPDHFVRRRGAAVALTLGNATGGATVAGPAELRILDISHLNYPGGVFLVTSATGVSGSTVTGKMILRRQDVDLGRGFTFGGAFTSFEPLIGSESGEIANLVVDQTLPPVTAGSVLAPRLPT